MSLFDNPKLTAIKGTDLAYVVTHCGRDMNGYDKKAKDIQRKYTLDNADSDGSEKSNMLRYFCVKLYIRNGRDIKELEEAISTRNSDGHIERPHLVGDIFFSAVNQNLTPDDNGNLLLKSYNSQLESIKIPGGDVLIDRDGKILMNTNGKMYIHRPDEFGSYRLDIFESSTQDSSRPKNQFQFEQNFLNASGQLISPTHFETTDKPRITPIHYKYKDKNEGKDLILDNLYPTGYVYTDPEQVRFFPSATALLIAHRSLLLEDPTAESPVGYISEQGAYITEHYRRQAEIDAITKRLTTRANQGFTEKRGGISYNKYKRANEILGQEQVIRDIFATEFETSIDRTFQPTNENEDTNELLD